MTDPFELSMESLAGPDPTVAAIAQRRAEYDLKAARWPVFARQLADSRDKVGWAKARSRAIGASDAASFAKVESAHTYLRAKLYDPFTGNKYTGHGNDREPVILEAMHTEQNFTLFGSAGNDRHVATPDAIRTTATGELFLLQVKTTLQKRNRVGDVVPPFTNAAGEFHLPPAYFRQMQWEMYVVGAERSLFVWEEHVDGRPTTMEPESEWIYRDDDEIAKLITIADLVLAGMDAGTRFARELENA